MVKKNDKIPATRLRIEKINKIHDNKIALFQSNVKELEDFLKDDALEQQNRKVSVTYLWFLRESDELVAYITLSPDCVKTTNINRTLSKKFKDKGIKYKSLPALKIGRLCVDDRYSHSGIGSLAIQFAIYKAKELSGDVGCRFLYLDAKRNTKEPKRDPIHFYKKFDFKIYKKENEKQKETPLYLDIFPITETLAD